MATYPKSTCRFDDLANDEAERREQLIGLFGHFVLDSKARAMEIAERLLSSEQARRQVGKIPAAPYEQLATQFGAETQKLILALCASSIDDFGRLLMGFLGQTGFSFEMDDGHVIRMRIDMEICDSETDEVVLSENINREGAKALASYWGSWLLNHSRNESS